MMMMMMMMVVVVVMMMMTMMMTKTINYDDITNCVQMSPGVKEGIYQQARKAVIREEVMRSPRVLAL